MFYFKKNLRVIKATILYCILFFTLPIILNAQKNCEVKNQAFQAGERLNYKIDYNWGFIWMSTGEANFSSVLSDLNGKKVLHFSCLGTTYPQYDWFYKVYDIYESYVDSVTLKPLRFNRVVNEGSNYAKDDYVFNHQKNKVYTSEKRNKKPVKLDSTSITACTDDLLAAIYHTRCLDFSIYKPKDTIPVIFVLDSKVYFSNIRYLGKETIHSELLGDVRCIKFSPKLIEGTIFKSGEGMTVWVTDDKNKVPVYIETPIIVGTVKVKLSAYSGLRNKIDCLIQK